MQRAHVERGAPQRHAVAEQAPAQLVEQLDIAVDLRALAEDPAGDLTARYSRTQAGIGAFGAEELFAGRRRVRRDVQGHARHLGQRISSTPESCCYAT